MISKPNQPNCPLPLTKSNSDKGRRVGEERQVQMLSRKIVD